jgi:hypothetical protein
VEKMDNGGDKEGKYSVVDILVSVIEKNNLGKKDMN